MEQKYILYNPYAGNGKCKHEAELLEVVYENTVLMDMCKISSYEIFLSGLDDSDEIILCGGDGTLNRFVNDTRGIEIKNSVYYYPVGSGNDFARDLGKEKGANPSFRINQYIQGLPSVSVNGENRLFLNGIGYGIDGYCCEEGDKQRAEGSDSINYTAIAIKGLMFRFKPRNATVIVDGVVHNYKNVWLAPTMNGRFYGGGMMVAPNQDRLREDGLVSTVVMHCKSKVKTLAVFPSIFKGEHIRHKEMVEVMVGKEIKVIFDQPTALQIDGETVSDVSSYCVHSYAACTAASKKENQAFAKV